MNNQISITDFDFIVNNSEGNDKENLISLLNNLSK